MDFEGVVNELFETRIIFLSCSLQEIQSLRKRFTGSSGNSDKQLSRE